MMAAARVVSSDNMSRLHLEPTGIILEIRCGFFWQKYLSNKNAFIPVACIPSATVAVSRGGTCSRGCTWSQGGVPGLGHT